MPAETPESVGSNGDFIVFTEGAELGDPFAIDPCSREAATIDQTVARSYTLKARMNARDTPAP
jgi:hypothetical protein